MENHNNLEKESYHFDAAWIIILFSILLLIVFYTYVFTHSNSSYAQTSQILSNILAPLISFFAAILVYMSFRQQVTANEIITRNFKEDIQLRIQLNKLQETLNLIELLNYKIQAFSYKDLKGYNAIILKCSEFLQDESEIVKLAEEVEDDRKQILGMVKLSWEIIYEIHKLSINRESLGNSAFQKYLQTFGEFLPDLLLKLGNMEFKKKLEDYVNKKAGEDKNPGKFDLAQLKKFNYALYISELYWATEMDVFLQNQWKYKNMLYKIRNEYIQNIYNPIGEYIYAKLGLENKK